MSSDLQNDQRVILHALGKQTLAAIANRWPDNVHRGAHALEFKPEIVKRHPNRCLPRTGWWSRAPIINLGRVGVGSGTM